MKNGTPFTVEKISPQAGIEQGPSSEESYIYFKMCLTFPMNLVIDLIDSYNIVCPTVREDL